MRHQNLKEAAGGALRSSLRISTRRKGGEGEMPPTHTIYYDSRGYFPALIPLSTTLESFKKLLEDADTNPEPPKEPTPAEGRDLPPILLTLLGICDPTTMEVRNHGAGVHNFAMNFRNDGTSFSVMASVGGGSICIQR